MNRNKFIKTVLGASALTFLPLSIFAAENNNCTTPINNNDPDGVGEGYRIPKIEEFIVGFEFQEANDCGLVIWDPKSIVQSSTKWQRFWDDSKVPSFKEASYPHTMRLNGGRTVTVMNSDGLTPFRKNNYYLRIKHSLEEGRMRTKI